MQNVYIVPIGMYNICFTIKVTYAIKNLPSLIFIYCGFVLKEIQSVTKI